MGAPAISPTTCSDPCPGCRTPLPPRAVFCVECGLCMLDVTTSGTVIVRSPYAAETGEIRVIEEVELDVEELEPSDRDQQLEAEPTREWTSTDIDLLLRRKSSADDRPSEVTGEIDHEHIEEIEPDEVIVDVHEIVAHIAGALCARQAVETTQVTRGPVRPRPYWDAPGRGQTVRRRNPLLMTTRYRSVG